MDLLTRKIIVSCSPLCVSGAFGLIVYILMLHGVNFAVCDVEVFVGMSKWNTNLFSHCSPSLPLSLSLSVPLSLPLSLLLSLLSPGEEQEAECVVLVLAGALRWGRTVTRGAVLSDIHPLTLPHTHWRSNTHAATRKHTQDTHWRRKTHTGTRKQKPHRTQSWRIHA